MATVDQTMAVSRVIGHLDAERSLALGRIDHEATVAVIDSLLADLYAAFPELHHLRKDPSS